MQEKLCGKGHVTFLIPYTTLGTLKLEKLVWCSFKPWSSFMPGAITPFAHSLSAAITMR